MAIDIRLKMKYRNPNSRDWTGRTKNVTDPDGGTRVWVAQRFKPNPGQAGNGRAGQFGSVTIRKSRGKTVRPRRRAYGPF